MARQIEISSPIIDLSSSMPSAVPTSTTTSTTIDAMAEHGGESFIKWDDVVYTIFDMSKLPFLANKNLKFESLEKLISFLEQQVTSHNECGKHLILCEQRVPIDHIGLLCEVLKKSFITDEIKKQVESGLCYNELATSLKLAEKLTTNLKNNYEKSFIYTVEPFTFTKDSPKKKIVLNSFNILNQFCLKTKLKGKKIPNIKKNYDASLIKTLESGHTMLECTREYFQHFLLPTTPPTPYNLGSLGNTILPELPYSVFIMICRPDILESELRKGHSQKGPTEEGENDTNTAKEPKETKLPSATAPPPSATDQTYSCLAKKRKIRKISERFTLSARRHPETGNIEWVTSRSDGRTWIGGRWGSPSN